MPYTWYASATNQFSVDEPQCATDTGKLFVALSNLKDYDPSLRSVGSFGL